LLALGYIEDRRLHAVVGDRTLPGSTYEHAGPLRAAISGIASFAFRTMVTGGVYDTQCGFKAFRGDVAQELSRLSRIDGFAIDVELIYLMLKYRLDFNRIPVRLRNSAPSTVRVVRDTARASRDILRMRRNFALGRYRSEILEHPPPGRPRRRRHPVREPRSGRPQLLVGGSRASPSAIRRRGGRASRRAPWSGFARIATSWSGRGG